jgi:hypothetical protein
MSSGARVAIPEHVAADVLFRHDRTCCVCQERGKPVQIHHIDDDPSNNAPTNLAALCFDCHNDTQIKGGFGRKLNAAQVIKYRDDWMKRVAEIRSKADKSDGLGLKIERSTQTKSPDRSTPNITNIQGIVTQDQKGGQNIVNNYGPRELHITPDQRQKFLAAIPNGAGTRIGVRLQDGSNAGRGFFREIVALFGAAGWLPIETDAANTLPGNHTGLLIEHGEPIPALASAIAKAFDEAGISNVMVRGPWPTGTEAFRLVVWPTELNVIATALESRTAS